MSSLARMVFAVLCCLPAIGGWQLGGRGLVAGLIPAAIAYLFLTHVSEDEQAAPLSEQAATPPAREVRACTHAAECWAAPPNATQTRGFGLEIKHCIEIAPFVPIVYISVSPLLEGCRWKHAAPKPQAPKAGPRLAPRSTTTKPFSLRSPWAFFACECSSASQRSKVAHLCCV